jgi:hypothetical protein
VRSKKLARMELHLGDRQAEEAHARFVGRSEELHDLVAAARREPGAAQTIFVHGPAGIGKTELLRELVRACADEGIAVHRVDARGVESAPGEVARALTPGAARVVVVDNYEQLAAVDDWLRERWLPELPADVVLVLAGRAAPALAWRRLGSIRSIRLRGLDDRDAIELLRRRGVHDRDYEAILSFTHGHPLALALASEVAMQRGRLDVPFAPQAEPDLVRGLLRAFDDEVPDATHRRALEACAVVRTMTEPMLASMLVLADARSLFEWLAALSFVELGASGLAPHDIGRSYTWPVDGEISPGWASDRDVPALVAMVERHEGTDSAAIAKHWLSRQIAHVQVARDAQGAPVGFVASIHLDVASPADLRVDPAAATARRYLNQLERWGNGETTTIHRFWMSAATYQAPSPARDLVMAMITRHNLTTRRLGYNFLPTADPEIWAESLAYADVARTAEVDFSVGGRRYGVFAHDWRTHPPASWLRLLAHRASAGPLARLPGDEPVFLTHAQLEQAVRDAVRNLRRPQLLRANPLMRAAIVQGKPESLQAVLREAIAALQADARTSKWSRALAVTYDDPGIETQEQAADKLGLAFSTYRRYLAAALAEVTEMIWQRQIDA